MKHHGAGTGGGAARSRRGGDLAADTVGRGARSPRRAQGAPESGSGIGFGKRIGDGTTEAIGRFTDVGVADSLEAIEAQLERALAKLAEGSYGACDSCGAEIAAGRLRIRPESTVCVDCAAR